MICHAQLTNACVVKRKKENIQIKGKKQTKYKDKNRKQKHSNQRKQNNKKKKKKAKNKIAKQTKKRITSKKRGLNEESTHMLPMPEV